MSNGTNIAVPQLSFSHREERQALRKASGGRFLDLKYWEQLERALAEARVPSLPLSEVVLMNPAERGH